MWVIKERVLKQKTYDIALKMVGIYKQIVAGHKEYVLSRQFLKAGTAPGALVRVAGYGQSKPGFISKMSIALKKSNECHYCTNLLRDADFITPKNRPGVTGR